MAASENNHSWSLAQVNDHLELQHDLPQAKPIYVDFLSGTLKHRQLYGGGEMLARAVGIKSNYKPYVIDATAGLGTDAFILASLGCKVHMLERSETIGALLADGLKRAQQIAELKSLQLTLTITDANYYLEKLSTAEFPDVIYLDPMFPERTKTALVKKEMRILQAVVGKDLDAAALLATAIAHAKKRVVVKRPRLAPPLAGQKPSFNLTGKSSRFDVYIINK